MNCLSSFSSPQLKTLHQGKVRDSIRIDDQTRMIVVTDRISAFNKKIKTPIPFKGAVLNGIANFWFDKTKDIIDNHIIQKVDDAITLVKEAKPIRLEMIVRGYLTGSMWRGYQEGKREFSGVVVKDGMTKNQRFESPILTPTTKDDFDTEINEQAIVASGIVSQALYDEIKRVALALFQRGTEHLASCGITLVDTKYEFGLLNGHLILIDEIHTPDSSRFWKTEDYEQNPQTAEQIDKEFVRQWMLANKIDGEVPSSLSLEVIQETSRRYIEIYERITGAQFYCPDIDPAIRMQANLEQKGILYTGAICLLVASKEDLAFAKKLEVELKAYNVFVTSKTLWDTTVSLSDVLHIYEHATESVAIIQCGETSLLTKENITYTRPLIKAYTQEQDKVSQQTNCITVVGVEQAVHIAISVLNTPKVLKK